MRASRMLSITAAVASACSGSEEPLESDAAVDAPVVVPVKIGSTTGVTALLAFTPAGWLPLASGNQVPVGSRGEISLAARCPGNVDLMLFTIEDRIPVGPDGRTIDVDCPVEFPPIGLGVTMPTPFTLLAFDTAEKCSSNDGGSCTMMMNGPPGPTLVAFATPDGAQIARLGWIDLRKNQQVVATFTAAHSAFRPIVRVLGVAPSDSVSTRAGITKDDIEALSTALEPHAHAIPAAIVRPDERSFYTVAIGTDRASRSVMVRQRGEVGRDLTFWMPAALTAALQVDASGLLLHGSRRGTTTITAGSLTIRIDAERRELDLGPTGQLPLPVPEGWVTNSGEATIVVETTVPLEENADLFDDLRVDRQMIERVSTTVSLMPGP